MTSASPVTTTTATPTSRLNGLAVAGFIVALVGLVLFFAGWLGALIALVGLVLSILGKVQLGRLGDRGNGLALAGIILGAVGLVAGIAYTVVLVSVLLPQVQQMH